MRSKMLFSLIALILVTSLVIAGCAAPAPAPAPKPEPIELTAISALRSDHAMIHWLDYMVEQVNERSGGELTIKYLGGPEVSSAFDQADAIRSGTFDMAYAITAYYHGTVPEAVTYLSRRDSPAEEREVGLHDYLDQVHQQKLNAKYLGRSTARSKDNVVAFYLWLVPPVETLDDLVGLKIRVAPAYAPWVEGLGAVPISMPHSETYTALERGVVDGLNTPISSTYAHGYMDVIKYQIAHPAMQMEDNFLMNLDTWNSLPKHLQNLVMDIVLEIEAKSAEYFAGIEEKALREIIDDYGVKQISFSPDEAERYVDTAFDASWDKLSEDLDQATISKLRELMNS